MKNEDSFAEFLGKMHDGYKGQAAIDKLLEEKNGYVPAAFHRGDIGDIDLVWGNEGAGLAHIIKRRTDDGLDAAKFLSNMSETIEGGRLHQKNERGRFEILYKGKMAIVSPEYKGNKITFILTAYRTRKK